MKGDQTKMNKKSRTASLILILFLLVFVSWSFAEEKKYPPYPDVWGYEFPWPGKGDRNSSLNITKIADGDYIITYVKKREKFKRKDGSCCDYIHKYEGLSFFSGKIFTEDEYKKIRRENIKSGLKIISNEGNIIESISIATSAHCASPFYDHYIIKKDRNGKIIEKKMLLYYYDNSQKTDINKYCERNNSYSKDYILKRVENVYAKVSPLEDGTFFLYDPEGNFIIRFDEKFSTKSTLINRRVFLVNRLDFEKIYEKQSKEGRINDQEMNDAVTNYLINLKKEAAK